MAECLGLLARFPAPQPLVDAAVSAWVIGGWMPSRRLRWKPWSRYWRSTPGE
jgi:hypothetical protein